MIELDDLFHCINHILKVFVRERIVERKAHNLRIILFCVGTKAFFISKLFQRHLRCICLQHAAIIRLKIARNNSYFF